MNLTHKQISCIKKAILALNIQCDFGCDDILYDVSTGYFPSTMYDVTHDCPIYDHNMSFHSTTSALSGEYDYCGESTCQGAKLLLGGSFAQYFDKHPFILEILGLTSMKYDYSLDDTQFIDSADTPFVIVVPYGAADTLQSIGDGCLISHEELRDELKDKL